MIINLFVAIDLNSYGCVSICGCGTGMDWLERLLLLVGRTGLLGFSLHCDKPCYKESLSVCTAGLFESKWSQCSESQSHSGSLLISQTGVQGASFLLATSPLCFVKQFERMYYDIKSFRASKGLCEVWIREGF